MAGAPRWIFSFGVLGDLALICRDGALLGLVVRQVEWLEIGAGRSTLYAGLV